MSAVGTSPGAACVLLRVWLPDRPGALGAVASRIGAVAGDIVGIDVLERNDGVAIDEFGVVLADAEHLPLLVREVEEVDGCRVEHVTVVSHFPDPRLDALISVAVVCEADDAVALQNALATYAGSAFQADWVAVMDEDRVLAALREPAGRQLPGGPGPGRRLVTGRRLRPGGPRRPGRRPAHHPGRRPACSGGHATSSGSGNGPNLLALARIADHVWRRLDATSTTPGRRARHPRLGDGGLAACAWPSSPDRRRTGRRGGRGPRPGRVRPSWAGRRRPRRRGTAAPSPATCSCPAPERRPGVAPGRAPRRASRSSCAGSTRLAAVAGRSGPTASILLGVNESGPSDDPGSGTLATDLLAAVALALLEDLGRPAARVAVLPVADLCRPWAQARLDDLQWEMPTPPLVSAP